jgi:agmatinase
MLENFDPNAASTGDSGIFGLPFEESEARLVYIPVPWEVTTSYGGGTSQGPQAILEASRQVDLYDLDVDRPYRAGLFIRPESEEVAGWNREGKLLAQEIIEKGGDIEGDARLEKALARVNDLSGQLNRYVYQQTKSVLDQGKIAAIIGGDHAVPLGAFKAVAEKHGDFGILHFDAHSDTRIAFEGFKYSHASIMYNALQELPQLKKLVQVGIRDFCEQEIVYCMEQSNRIKIHFDSDLQRARFRGENWDSVTQRILADLPEKVWISFDIDGLDPRFCPNTGTPVPGGLDFGEAVYLIAALAKSGRKIIGFDLNEVSPGDSGSEWDGNVGARLLYKLTAWTLFSQNIVGLAGNR